MPTQKKNKITLYDYLYLWCLTVYVWINHAKLITSFLKRIKKLPNILFPKSINDKFLWRKTFDHDFRFVIVSDKLACKNWVSKRVPELKIAKVLWQGEDVTTIPTELYAINTVLKANHGSKTNLLINANDYDLEDLTKKAKIWLNYDHGKRHREWAYSCIERKLFLEEMIESKTEDLTELKIFTFGEAIGRIIHIGGRVNNLKANAWEIDNNDIPFSSKEPATLANPDPNMKLPASLPVALQIARKLGKEFDHIRVDLLFDGIDYWLGELTVYNQAGYMFIPSARDTNSSLSKLWDIRKSNFLMDQKKNKYHRRYISILMKYLSR